MSGVGTVLVTNDDGVDSPALVPLADALADLGEVHVVVPDGERSWSGKSMTRFTSVGTVATGRGDHGVTTVDGTPADAAQVGCSLLAPGPDVVVSGINLGHNHGTAFASSSGTIGAAVEAVLLGHHAIAVSTGTMDDDFAGWRRLVAAEESAVDWRRLAALTRDIVDDILTSGLLDTCDLVSVNLPWAADTATPRRVTTMAETRYGAMLRPHGDEGRWQATYGGLTVLPGPTGDLLTDLDAADAGEVSVTPLRMWSTVDVAAGVRDRVER